MLTPALIVLALLVLGAGIVIWASRKKPDHPTAPPRDDDTAWADPVTRGDAPTPRDTFTHEDAPTATRPPQDPRP